MPVDCLVSGWTRKTFWIVKTSPLTAAPAPVATVMAVTGVDAVRAAYREAVAREYRFYSYGDAMAVL